MFLHHSGVANCILGKKISNSGLQSPKGASYDKLPRNVVESKVQHLSLKCSGVISQVSKKTNTQVKYRCT